MTPTRASLQALARQPHRLVLIGLTALAAILRLGTLDLQSFWADEASTVQLLHLDLPSLLRAIPHNEGTPPVYYVVAWGWTQLFGTGEVGLRSLSALAGIAVVPVSYAAAAELCSRRVALGVAALAAVNPILIWYSQEARAYSLVVLLGTITVWAFARLLKSPDRGRAVVWFLASALALATHYFAAFLVASEAVWLLAERRTRRWAAPAVAGLAVVGLALIPLAVDQLQLGVASWITATGSLPYRAARSAKQALLGFDAPLEDLLTLVTAALAGAGLVFALRFANGEDRRGLRIAAVLAAGAVGVPLALAAVGRDYIDVRNLLVAWCLLAVLIAGGLVSVRAGRGGLAALFALCLIEASATIGVELEPSWQREDWRGAASALGSSGQPRALVIQPNFGVEAMQVYLPGTRPMPQSGASVREIDFVTTVVRSGADVHPEPPPHAAAPPVPGFRCVERRYEKSYTLIRLRAESPHWVWPRPLEAYGLSDNSEPGALLIPAKQ